jgi:hypothetical protein
MNKTRGQKSHATVPLNCEESLLVAQRIFKDLQMTLLVFKGTTKQKNPCIYTDSTAHKEDLNNLKDYLMLSFDK